MINISIKKKLEYAAMNLYGGNGRRRVCMRVSERGNSKFFNKDEEEQEEVEMVVVGMLL